MARIISVILAVVFGVLVISLVVDAASTISTNLATGGTLTVDGASTLTGNVTAAGTLAVTGASTLTGDVTMSGGSGALVITTTNAATSTIQVGCIQTTATSTETPVRLVLSSAASSTPTFGAGNAVGGVSWQYGTCPI